ncbi:Glutamate decarboxylase 2 [Coemansia javaensis]|uniref:Glutamate decarboxylase 2 n=1 Tax=Coemansia javaensis TaxID=2761396 RepID=A0A9W8H9N7_9FUNG|nr:Glutamate decarboxylase 2 [Coemansia javaensis]
MAPHCAASSAAGQTGAAEETQPGAADELRALLIGASDVLSEYVAQSQQPQARVLGGRSVQQMRADLRLDEFPDKGAGADGIWDDVRAVCGAAANTWSSRFLYKLYAAPAPAGVVGEALLGVLNNNSHVFRASPAGTLIESSVAAKLAELAGFPAQTEGLTFPGGSYANMHALVTARNCALPDARRRGLHVPGGRAPVVLTSRHAHYSVDKAAMAAGLGLEGVAHVPTDGHGRMDARALRRMLQRAVDGGLAPVMVNATMGTTVLGACDPLDAIAAVCEDFGVWLHVDASWGGPLALFGGDPPAAPAFAVPRGRIDSMTINPHKLLGVPLQCSFLLVRRGLGTMRQALGLNAGYLFHDDADASELDLGDATLGCGRRPDAIKLWLMWRYYGTAYFVRRVAHARRMALRLAELVRTRTSPAGRWRLVQEPPSTCVCFWFVPRQLAGGSSDEDERWGLATRRICERVNASGTALVDYASVDLPRPGPSGAPEMRRVPDFFRIPLNSPDVAEDALVAVLDAIELAASGLTF